MKIFPVVKKTITQVVSGGGPNMLWASTTRLRDSIASVVRRDSGLLLTDGISAVRVGVTAGPFFSDAKATAFTDLTAAKQSSLVLREQLRATISRLDVSADSCVDASQPTSNFVSLRVRGDNSLAGGNDELQTWAYFDLTKLAGLTATSSATFTLQSTNSGISADTISYELRSGTTVPFSETGINFNNRPTTYGTQRDTGSISVGGGGPTTYTFTLDSTNFSTAISQGYLLVILSHSAVIGPATHTISDRNSGNGLRLSVSVRK